MRVQLLHLSGPRRGTTRTYDETEVLVGSAPEAEVQLHAPAVAPKHAVVRFDSAACSYHLQRRDGRVFVNHREVDEVILKDGDLIEWGLGGPKSRFRIDVGDGRACKPVRQMLADAKQVRQESGALAATGSLTRDLLTHATPRLKIGIPVAVALVLLPLAWLAGWLGAQPTAARLRELQEQQREGISREEVQKLREKIQANEAELRRMAEANAAVRRINDVYARGVCLIHGIYGLRKPDGTVHTLSDGKRLEIEYLGSGFLASPRGHVITNRHVVAPWLEEPFLMHLIDSGAEPVFFRLTATFPGLQPIDVDPDTVVRRIDDLDVALLRVDVEGVPVVPLMESGKTPLAGTRAIVVGYPTGLNALLAKADAELVGRLTFPGSTMTTIIDGLAAGGAVSPVVTQGILGNVLEKKLVYDAETTHGGSGGPVFGVDGTVIGVNYAVLREFTGSNFGVPIRFARELLPQ